MANSLIPFSLVEQQTVGAVRQGLSLDKLLADSMIIRRFGDERDVITPTQYLLLCLNTLLEIGDASHGLAKVGLGPLYPAIGLRMSSAYPNLGDALAALCRFYSMASQMHFKLDCRQTTATLSIHIDAWTEQDAAQIEEIQLGWLFINCLHFLGRPPPVLHVSVRNPRHFNLGRRHWAIGGTVHYGATTSFTFPRHLLGAAPGVPAGPTIFWECHRRWLDFVEAPRPAPSLDAYLGDGGFVRFSDLVRASGKSPNTVRGRLQADGGGFRDLRRRALVAALTTRLRGGDDSVDVLAAELGYSDARSLRRFLKNATGLTPKQVRQTDEACAPDPDSVALARLKSLTEMLSI